MKTKLKKIYPELTQRRIDFVKFYLIDPNGEKSAIKAGFSPATAAQQASRLLNNVKVQERIAKLRKAREDRLEASADFVVRELMRIASLDLRLAYGDNNQLLDMKSLPDNVAKCISGVEVFEEFDGRGEDKELIGYTKKIKCWDKVKALELLGQHFGIFKRPGEEDPEQSGKNRKLDLLTVIKTISKDGKTTIVSNRVTSGQRESVGVDQSGSRGYSIL